VIRAVSALMIQSTMSLGIGSPLCRYTVAARVLALTRSNRRTTCVSCVLRVQITDLALRSGRENEAPSEAGPQQRVDSKGRGSPAGGSSAQSPLHQQRWRRATRAKKRRCQELLEQVPLYHWHGCRKIRSFFEETDGEAASVASFRSGDDN